EVVAREHGNVHRSDELDAAALVRLLERCDALRKPQRFGEALLACECDARGRLGLHESAYPQRQRLLKVLEVAVAVPTADLAAKAMELGRKGPEIAQIIHRARVQAVAEALQGW